MHHVEVAEVNFGTRQIVRTGKGGRRVTFPITDSIREYCSRCRVSTRNACSPMSPSSATNG